MSSVRRTFVALAGVVMLTAGCRHKADAAGMQYALKCGMSLNAAIAVARNNGYVECGAPTAKGEVPDYGCHSASSEWVAFWLKDGRLIAYEFGDPEGECGQDSGCATPLLYLCGEARPPKR
jgi:hypothetical protein